MALWYNFSKKNGLPLTKISCLVPFSSFHIFITRKRQLYPKTPYQGADLIPNFRFFFNQFVLFVPPKLFAKKRFVHYHIYCMLIKPEISYFSPSSYFNGKTLVTSCIFSICWFKISKTKSYMKSSCYILKIPFQ